MITRVAFIRLCEQLTETCGWWVSWLSLLMVLVTFLIVVLRYGFNLGWISMQESVVYMHALLFLLASAYTLKLDGHVRVDIVYQTLSLRGRAWVDLLGTLLLLFPMSLFILWLSWEYVGNSWALLEGSREAGGLPLVFALKTAIPVMAILLIVQGSADIARRLPLLTGKPA
ncbi:MAG: TRAP transporter small permease subunit [Gammaproteobacteria bacterium]|nr:TRAP transporter small permease subunit [Gammaproteobacteria bacterium]